MSTSTYDVLAAPRRRPMRRRAGQGELSPVKIEKVPEPVIPAVALPTMETVVREESGAVGREIIERRRLDRRRQIDPTTCERDYSSPEIEFMRAMDDYKRKSGRPFPTWSEVLEVVLSLGYRKVADPSLMEWRTFADSSVTM